MAATTEDSLFWKQKKNAKFPSTSATILSPRSWLRLATTPHGYNILALTLLGFWRINV